MCEEHDNMRNSTELLPSGTGENYKITFKKISVPGNGPGDKQQMQKCLFKKIY